jgi:hypothetical protein
MRLGNTLTFAGTGTLAFNAGDIVVNRKKKCPMLALKCVIPIKNSTGGSAALTFAQVLSFFAGFLLTMTYGTQGRQPYVGTDFGTLLQIARDQVGDYWPGANDTNNMTATVGNGATKSATVYVQIPTGYRWKDGDTQQLGGIGPYQASTMQLAVQWASTTLPASWSINGNITMQLVYLEVDSDGEAWDFIPEYRQQQSAQSQIDGADGLTLVAFEKTAAASGSALTNVTVSVEGAEYPFHDQVAAADILAEYQADPELPTAAQFSDTYTPLISYNTRRKEREYVPGKPHFRQNGAIQLTPWVVGQLYRPAVSEAEVAAEVTAAAKALKREVRAVYLADRQKLEVPEWFKPFTQLVLDTGPEADARGLPSLRATEHSPAQAFIPSTTAAIEQKRGEVFRSANNGPAIAHQIHTVAARIPGGLSNPAGSRKDGNPGSSVAVRQVQAALGHG